MKTRIEKLDRDSLLMLYASGEISAEQKHGVDAMLAGDEAMQLELSRLIDAQAMLDRELSKMDMNDSMPATEAAAGRAVSRVIRQRITEQLARPMKIGATPKRRWMVLMYPAGIAAAVLGFGIYKWSKVQGDYGPTPPKSGTLFVDTDSAEIEEQYASAVLPDLDDSSDPLTQVEDQISTLAAWSQPLQ